MFRKTLVAIAATAVLSTAALAPSVASAKGFGGGGFGGGHHGFGGHGFGFALGAIGAIGTAAAVSNCWQYQMVQTPSGYYKRVLVNVCE